ncbi:hypothetical protein RYX36_021437 [Vicia faba]
MRLEQEKIKILLQNSSVNLLLLLLNRSLNLIVKFFSSPAIVTSRKCKHYQVQISNAMQCNVSFSSSYS